MKPRTGNGWGPSELAYSEIEAWSRLNGLRLSPWEVETLRTIDDAFLGAYADRPRAPKRPAPPRRASGGRRR